jgi:hypothetical protein
MTQGIRLSRRCLLAPAIASEDTGTQGKNNFELSDPDAARNSYQVVALLGVIYTARPGLDLDIGYRGRVSADGPVHQWLLGITFRGAR